MVKIISEDGKKTDTDRKVFGNFDPETNSIQLSNPIPDGEGKVKPKDKLLFFYRRFLLGFSRTIHHEIGHFLTLKEDVSANLVFKHLEGANIRKVAIERLKAKGENFSEVDSDDEFLSEYSKKK